MRTVIREAGVECDLPGLAQLQMKSGDRVRIEQLGGGWGNPKLRDPAAVLRDVDDGVVSLESAPRADGFVATCEAAGDMYISALERA